MRKSVLPWFVCLVVVSITCRAGLGAKEAGNEAPDATVAGFLGEWSENWGTPGHTDVTYHDQYRISRKSDAAVKVTILNRDQAIWNERIEDQTLAFTQKTDVYEVRYSLTLQPDHNSLIGTATTPKGTFVVKWLRTGSAAAEPRAGAPAANIAAFWGEWSENWGTPGHTDVTYHDQYRISRKSDTAVKVTILNRDQLIENERVEDATLTFTQHTDVFVVRYSLTLQPDHNWLIGTATTPRGTFEVKWERTK